MKTSTYRRTMLLSLVAFLCLSIGNQAPRAFGANSFIDTLIAAYMVNPANVATQTTSGVMASTDKSKLDILAPVLGVDAATVAALPAYSTSGGPGAGFTLTFAACPASIDGVAQAVNRTFLLHHGSSGADNGVYRWITYASGGAGTATRVPGFDTAANLSGGKLLVRNGARLAGTSWTFLNREAITMGTTRIFYWLDSVKIPYSRVYSTDFNAVPNTTANASLAISDFISTSSAGTNSGAQLGPGASGSQALCPVNSAVVQGIFCGSAGTVNTGFFGFLNGWTRASTAPDGGGSILIQQDMGFEFRWRLGTSVLSTGTTTYALNVGLAQERNAGQKYPANGTLFVYDSTGATTTKWATVASTASVTTGTLTDSGVTVTVNQLYNLMLRKDIGSLNVQYWIDDVLISTYSTNIPNIVMGMQAMDYNTFTGTFPVGGMFSDSYSESVQWPQGRY